MMQESFESLKYSVPLITREDFLFNKFLYYSTIRLVQWVFDYWNLNFHNHCNTSRPLFWRWGTLINSCLQKHLLKDPHCIASHCQNKTWSFTKNVLIWQKRISNSAHQRGFKVFVINKSFNWKLKVHSCFWHSNPDTKRIKHKKSIFPLFLYFKCCKTCCWGEKCEFSGFFRCLYCKNHKIKM